MVIDKRYGVHGDRRLGGCQSRERHRRRDSYSHNYIFSDLQRRERYLFGLQCNCDGVGGNETGADSQPVGKPAQHYRGQQLHPDMVLHQCDCLHRLGWLDRREGNERHRHHLSIEHRNLFNRLQRRWRYFACGQHNSGGHFGLYNTAPHRHSDSQPNQHFVWNQRDFDMVVEQCNILHRLSWLDGHSGNQWKRHSVSHQHDRVRIELHRC